MPSLDFSFRIDLQVAQLIIFYLIAMESVSNVLCSESYLLMSYKMNLSVLRSYSLYTLIRIFVAVIKIISFPQFIQSDQAFSVIGSDPTLGHVFTSFGHEK